MRAMRPHAIYARPLCVIKKKERDENRQRGKWKIWGF